MKKQILILLSVVLLAGIADGTKDKILFHYGKSIFSKLPADKQTCFNPQISWKLKYKDVEAGDYRPRFPLSKSALVFVTDFWHLLKQIWEILIFGAISLAAWLRPKWYWIIGSYAIYKGGFYLMYDFVLNL